MATFCKNCGEPMPDDSKFCPKCGANQDEGKVREVRMPECSEKNQLTMFLPGRGLYFIVKGERLCRYDEKRRVVEPLTEREAGVRLCGLGYSDGLLYYWQECSDERSEAYGMYLFSLDPETRERKTVWHSSEELFFNYRLDDNQMRARAILYQGAYYLLDYEDQSLMRVALPGGEQTNFLLPDLRAKLPPYDWIVPRGYVDNRMIEENFGLNYTGLNLVDGQIYISLDGYPMFTLRYPVDNPNDVCYFPANTCSAIDDPATGGMVTCINHKIFSCPGVVQVTENEIGIYETVADGRVIKLISNKKDDVYLIGRAASWWRLGNTVYIGQVALDVSERRWHKLPFLFFDTLEHKNNTFGNVRDFFPGKGGNVYLLTDNDLYLVPLNWEKKIKYVKEIDQFRVASLKKL